LAVANGFEPDLIVGVGGGSSMDCAKGINFLYTNGGRMEDYQGEGKATRPMLASIGVPTTAGTGSEAQSFALISHPKTGQKMACGDPKASFRIALLDPELTLTQPAPVTALSGIDALSHALETFVTRRRNAASMALSREAWRLLSENFPQVLVDPDNLQRRSAVQVGACFAGLAIENSMLGATHALANPLSAHYRIVHGQAIAVMLPHVIRFNGQQFDNWYRDLLEAKAGENGMPPPDRGAMGIAEFVENLVEQAGLHARLSACGVSRGVLPRLAQQAAAQWTCRFNPRDAGREELLQLYEQAY
jgi:alcohol dehydrogenase